MTDSDLLDVEQAARYLTTSRRTLYRAISRGRLRMVKVEGSTRFRQSELDRYLREREREARGRVA